MKIQFRLINQKKGRLPVRNISEDYDELRQPGSKLAQPMRFSVNDYLKRFFIGSRVDFKATEIELVSGANSSDPVFIQSDKVAFLSWLRPSRRRIRDISPWALSILVISTTMLCPLELLKISTQSSTCARAHLKLF